MNHFKSNFPNKNFVVEEYLNSIIDSKENQILRPNVQDSSSEKYYKNVLSSAMEKFRKDQEKQETLFTRIRTKVPQSARCKQRGIGI